MSGNVTSTPECLRRRAVGVARALFAVVALAGVSGCDVFGPSAPRWQALSASRSATCGLTEGGSVYCWGGLATSRILDPSIELDSVFPASARPARVSATAATRFVALSSAEHTYCAVDVVGDAYCGGLNAHQALGVADPGARRSLTLVAGGHRWRSVAAGSVHSCGLTSDGEAYCWGTDVLGSLGAGGELSATVAATPTKVVGDHRFVSIGVGDGFTCALDTAGAAWCWGANDLYKLGVGTASPGGGSSIPLAVAGGLRFATLEVGRASACGVTLDGSAYCWGHNASGQLGDGSVTARRTPTRVAGSLRWARVVPYQTLTCGLTTRDALYCWGQNAKGVFGPGATTQAFEPRPLAPAGSFTGVAVGSEHLCAIRFDGVTLCWGDGQYGQLGHGDVRSRDEPTPIAG